MTRLPQRVLLTDQAAEVLREGLSTARWQRELPSEAELCGLLQISRFTLRRAMDQLVLERWIEPGGRGRHHRIIRTAKAPSETTARTVRLLIPFSSASLGSALHDIIESFKSVISAAGYQLELECNPRVFEKFQPRKLRELNALPDTAAWVLCFSSEPMQRWFASCGRPCIVAGQLHDSLPLCSIHQDPVALARHAAGLLTARNHRDLVYLIANLTSVTDRLASQSFVAEARRLGAVARIVNYEADIEAEGKAIKNLIASRPQPTGWFVASSELAVTALCHLLSAGIRVPTDVSIISGWDEQILAHTHPTIARYRLNGKALGKQMGAMLLDLLRNGAGKIREVRLLPEFISGGSLRPAFPKSLS